MDFSLELGTEVLRRTPVALQAMLSDLSEYWIDRTRVILIDVAGPGMLYGATSASVRGSIPARLRARSALRW
jgi:hypothetical protein